MDTLYNPLNFSEVSSTPSNPPAGFLKIYAKTDGLMYYLDPMGVERKLVIPDGTVSGSAQLKTINSQTIYGSGNIEITGSTNGSGSQLTTADILICTTPRKSGKFILTGSFNPNINVQQAAGVYINKGTLTDEAEMDSLKISAIVTNPSTSICYWNCNTSVKGYFKINY